MRYPIAALVAAITFATLGGCGQMGPLYMPGEAPPGGSAEQADNSSPQSEDS